MYKYCLFTHEIKFCHMNVNRSVDHVLKAQKVKKKRRLVPFDDKRL